MSENIVTDEFDFEDDELRAWDRQWWDTDASFAAFLFYLSQVDKRSVIRAWRLYHPTVGYKNESNDGTADSADNSDDLLPTYSLSTPKPIKTPPHFRNWVKGRDTKGQPITGALTWAERVKAYDRWVAESVNQKLIERKAKAAENALSVVEDATGKLMETLSKFQPTGDEGIGELTLSATRIVNLIGQVFSDVGIAPNQIEVTVNDGKQAAENGSERAKQLTDNLTSAEKLGRIAALLAVAEKRKNDADEGG